MDNQRLLFDLTSESPFNLTPQWLQSITGFEHYSEEEAAKILQNFIKLASTLLTDMIVRDKHEEKLIGIVRGGEYDSVEISFKDKKMHSLALQKEQDTKRKIVEVLKENPFQEISIKSHRGKITTFRSTVKIKLDNPDEANYKS